MTNDTQAKRNVVVLVMAQALLGAQMPMLFLVAGLAGQGLATNICFATLPISMIVLGSMLSATPVSAAVGCVLSDLSGGVTDQRHLYVRPRVLPLCRG